MSDASNTTTTANEPIAQTVVNREGPHTSSADETKMRSGVTGAIIGFLFGGPLLSAVLGFFAAYASQKNDKVGGYARSLGDFGVMVKDKALALDEKYHIAERSTKAAERAWDKAKEYDAKYNLLDKTRDMALNVWVLLLKYIREHRLMERGIEVTGRGYEYVAKRIGADESKNESQSKKEGI
eukprot:CAMPEP_0197465658 /NCGR_PEP_ID=MMETSP1175-20131217/64650_1 /TAXON_ID=1003142 /ORGANISM="Triceratium dubium, Strain CCMP147" /LENGTH=181 /DNA_ID=CAMNT_0043001677 /DNA_START=143 /DNA_END=688 /DNA_ORIENTATION=+